MDGNQYRWSNKNTFDALRDNNAESDNASYSSARSVSDRPPTPSCQEANQSTDSSFSTDDSESSPTSRPVVHFPVETPDYDESELQTGDSGTECEPPRKTLGARMFVSEGVPERDVREFNVGHKSEGNLPASRGRVREVSFREQIVTEIKEYDSSEYSTESEDSQSSPQSVAPPKPMRNAAYLDQSNTENRNLSRSRDTLMTPDSYPRFVRQSRFPSDHLPSPMPH